MRSYSLPEEFSWCAYGVKLPEVHLRRTGVPYPSLMILTFFIRAEYRVAQTLRALAVRQLIAKARRTDFIIKQVVQVIVYCLTHINITLFHMFIVLVLHVDHNVASLVWRRRATEALHSFTPSNSG